MKKSLLSLAFGAALVLALPVFAYTPGTYTGTGMGHNGEVAVEVTVSEDTIEDIQVTQTAESAYMGEVASERVISQVLEYQSLGVDAVSGCTLSRIAFVNAITDALQQAGADTAALRAVEIPEKVGEERTIDTDVVVIGAGGAGLVAAIQAAYKGADVVVLEKLARVGGSTLTSSAMLIAGGTSLQEEAGIEDSPEALKQYLIDRGEGIADQEWTDFFGDHVNDVLSWFMDLGVNYTKDLILIQGTADVARAHMPLESGRELIPRLTEEAMKNGVEILTETPAVSLLQAEDGTVTGVLADDHGAAVTVNAKATIIATGGYACNADMLAEYAPDAVGTWPESSPGSTGDGIVLGTEAGAGTVFKGGFIGWKVVSPGNDQTTAIGAPLYGAANLVVNAEGNRFADESRDYPFLYDDMAKDGSDTFYFIFDSGDKETKDLVNNVSDTVKNLEIAVDAGFAFKADTIEELAEVSSLPGLVDAAASFNAAIESGTDEAFGRDTAGMIPVVNGPFYALQCKKATLGTFGGLDTKITGEALTPEGEVITGLYAAGEVANGNFFPRLYPSSGAALGEAVVFGVEAGKSAADFALANE